MSHPDNPHKGQPVLRAGAELEEANAAVIMLHGRGGNAADILALSGAFDRPDLAYLAPQAAGNTWYPKRFLAPVRENEPGRTSALELIADIIGLAITHDITPDRIALLGFSQGACLSPRIRRPTSGSLRRHHCPDRRVDRRDHRPGRLSGDTGGNACLHWFQRCRSPYPTGPCRRVVGCHGGAGWSGCRADLPGHGTHRQ